jgi:hypothetical protein
MAMVLNSRHGARSGVRARASVLPQIAIGLVPVVALILAALLLPQRQAETPGGSVQEQPPTLSQCASIGDSAARLDCYDRAADRSPTHPAKGANVLFRSIR